MKILITAGEVKEIPPGVPPQNILTFALMPGSSMFLSGFNDEGNLWFTKRVPSGGNLLLDFPVLGVDWSGVKEQLVAEINALTVENAELRKKLIMSPPGIVVPGNNGGMKNL